jgi:hypothetical protein
MSNFVFVQAAPASTDINGHWAEKQISNWLSKSYVSTYKDGTFKPNTGITRAELASVVNKAFGFTEKDETNFKDVNVKDSFYDDMAIAKKAGYLKGSVNGNVNPTAFMTRQEFAIIIQRLMKLENPSVFKAINSFKDVNSFPSWSKDAIESIIAKGYMQGTPNKTFNPAGIVTRAEAITTLDRSFLHYIRVTYDKAGTYNTETVNGSVAINVPDVTLQNTVINGDLIIGKGVGEGNVTLKNVTIKGDTIVKGGGMNSIVVENCTLGHIVIIKEGNMVRVVAVGSTTTGSVDMQSGGKLEEFGTTDNGFGYVTIAESVDDGAPILLVGNFETIEVKANDVKLDLASGSVGSLDIAPTAINTNLNIGTGTTVSNLTLAAPTTLAGTGNVIAAAVEGSNVSLGVTGAIKITQLDVTTTATNSSINLGPGSTVTNIKVDSAASVTGTGSIGTAQVNVAGSTITAPTTSMNTATGVTVVTTPPATPATPTPTPAPTPTIPTSGGNSGGGGGGGSHDDDDINVRTITVIGTGNATTIATDNGTLQMLADISPTNATNKRVTWSVINGTGAATISSAGLLTAVSNGTVTVKATANDGSGKFGTKEITITGQIGVQGTIERASGINGGENVTTTVNGQTIRFDGEIAYYVADGISGVPFSGNWIGVKITAPEGVYPDENAVLTAHGQVLNVGGVPGWENIWEEGDGDNYFHLYQRVRRTAYVYVVEIKWNNEWTETYEILIPRATTLEYSATELEDLGNMLDGARDNHDNATDYGNIDPAAIDEFGAVIAAAEAVYDDTDATMQEIYAAKDELRVAMDAFWDSYQTEVEAVAENLESNTTYTDAEPLILTLSLVNGIGDFVADLEDYIALDGDLAGMSIKEVTLEGEPATRANVELTGDTGESIDNAGITIEVGGVNGHSHGFEAVWSGPEPVLQGTIERASDITGGENATYTVDDRSITFDGEIAYYFADEENCLPMSGNWVGVKITAPDGVMPDENAVLTVNGNILNLDGNPGWDNIREEGDGDNYFHLYQRVRDVSRVYEIEIKWNNELTETYHLEYVPTTTLEVYKADLEDMLISARTNYDNAENYGTISQEAIDALGEAIDAAQVVYDEAVDAKTEAVQQGIYDVQEELIAAMDAFWDSYETEVEAVAENLEANITYTDAEPLILTLSLVNGIGDFVADLEDYIALGGDLAGMSIKEITLEGEWATRAIVELTGDTGESIENAAITIEADGVNGHSHGFEAVWTPAID